MSKATAYSSARHVLSAQKIRRVILLLVSCYHSRSSSWCCQGLCPSSTPAVSSLRIRTGWVEMLSGLSIHSGHSFTAGTQPRPRPAGHLPVGKSSAQGWPGDPGAWGRPEGVPDPAWGKGDGARKDLEVGMMCSEPGAASAGAGSERSGACGDLGARSGWAALGKRKAGPWEPGQVVVWTLARGVDS